MERLFLALILSLSCVDTSGRTELAVLLVTLEASQLRHQWDRSVWLNRSGQPMGRYRAWDGETPHEDGDQH